MPALFFRTFLALCLTTSACAIEVREVVWGFDGRVVPEHFNLLSVLVANPGAEAFDGTVELHKSQGLANRVGAPYVQPCYVSAFSVRGGLPISLPGPVDSFFGWIWGIDPASAEQILILVLILVAFSWMGAARLVRGMILSLRTQEFAEAARALGGSSWHIILHHMIPNAMAPIIVSATLGIADIILTEAALSFLGFGVQIPTPSWGNMLYNVQVDMFTQPWRALVPGLAIFMTSLSANFVGDALRDALDPRLKI